MKKRVIFFIIVLMSNLTFAQSINYKTASDKFQLNYNAGHYDEIFNSFSPEMKQALSLVKTQQFFTNLKEQAGQIESKEFTKFHQKTFATYKAQFEKSLLSVNISLDADDKINGFFIEPYKEDKLIESPTINALNNFPKEISANIYAAAKDFPNNAQLAIAYIKNGKTNYYGVIKVNDTIKPIANQNKIFEIGSLTKVFTATVLASLVESGSLKLTDDINAYYPFAFKNNVKIDFVSLANHTSGLPRLPSNLDLSNTINPYKNYGKSDIEDYLKNLLKLESQSSKTYLYSNLGAGLLGYTLGLSQKTTFQNLLQKKIFDKYNMTSSFTSSKNLKNRLVTGLSKDGKIATNWDFDVLCGAGGILSTVEDLQKFVAAQFDEKNKALALTRQTTFHIKDNTAIALGWHKVESKDGDDLIWHNGGTGGYSSSIAMKIKQKIAVIILCNVSDVNDRVDALSFKLK